MNNPYALKALDLIKQGFTPIPLHGKAPIPTGWQLLRNLHADKIYDWERSGAFQNIGVVCGVASGNLVVIDFDGLAGYDLFAAQFPDLVNTLTIATGSGEGRHCYYYVELLPDSNAMLDIPMQSTGELVNIEIKSDGKQVVVPPSIHPETKKPYEVFKREKIMRLKDIAKVWQWVQTLKPQAGGEWKPPRSYSTGDDLNPKLLDAVERYFLSKPHKMSREWINCSCPNQLAHKHGDRDFSFGYHPSGGANCYVCGEMNLKTLLPLIGIDAKDCGGFYLHPEPPIISSSTPPHEFDVRTAAPSNTPPASNNAIPVITRSSRLTNYVEQMLDFDTPVSSPPIPMPLKVLHPFGGMARFLKPGKLVGIVATSGGGKTSLLETIIDGFLDYNVSSLVWSPEWDADEFIERSVQRYGGPTVDELSAHKYFKYEQQSGYKTGVGRELSEAQVKLGTSAVRTLRGWKEQVGYLDAPFLTIGTLQASIEATLQTIDFKPRVLAIDYLQLFHAMETNADLTMYNLTMRIKAICKYYGLAGVLASQVTKSSSKDQTSGKLLDSLDARYVNDDAFNLFVTINADYKDAVRQPSAVLNVAKNSMGSKGAVRVAVAWDRLKFSDTKHPDQIIEGIK